MSSRVLKATEGLIATATDLTLALIFYQFEIGLGGARTLYGVQRAGERTMDVLVEVNYKSIKRALRELKRRGLVKSIKSSLMEPEITAAGIKRIKQLFPEYQKKRPWDGNIYLVTYDIPIERNRERNLLREFLKKSGCGLLQESIWVTPYNPTKIVRQFVDERNLEGTVIVSVLGKDGSIGDMSLEELIENIYHLEELNERYRQFLGEYQGRLLESELLFHYLSVLQDDPQLPFELLPDWWLGDEAYTLFTKLINKSVK